MAGSADITGRQNYVMGIGHPKTTPDTESPPAIVSVDQSIGFTGLDIGASSLPAKTFAQSLLNRALAAENNNAVERPPLTALQAWTISTTVRAGYVVTANGNSYICQASGVTAASGSGPSGASINTIADGTTAWIYLGPARTAVASVDIPTLTFGSRPATASARANPITAPEKFLFSGGIPLTSGNGILLPAYTTKAAGSVVTTTPGKNNKNPCIEFITDAPVFYVNDTGFTMSQSFRLSIEIDGYAYRDSPIMGTGGTSLKFDFSAYPIRSRRIKLYWLDNAASFIFEGIYTEGAYGVWSPAQSGYVIKAAAIGTSLTAGTSFGSMISGQDWPSIFSTLVGLPAVTNIAEGSAGVISGTGTRFSFTERIQDIYDLAPDVFFIEGAHNDAAKTNAEQLAGYRSFLTNIRANLPNCLIVWFGTDAEIQSAVPSMRATETNIASVVSALNDPRIWYIPAIFDVSGSWYNGYRHTGNITAITNAASGAFTLSVTPTCVVGDSFVPFTVNGMAVNGLVGTVTGVAGNVVTTNIDTTSLGTFATSGSSFAIINDRYTSQDGLHPVQLGVIYRARRYANAWKRYLAARF